MNEYTPNPSQGPSHARGGDVMTAWNPSSEFQLRDESTNEDKDEDQLMVTGDKRKSGEDEKEESDDDKEMAKEVLAHPSERKQPCF
ncbi:unnamed protein product [Lactuca virosa]|uniref:Uncharacterized protein n=1 Tax=Lactuca virosa TaxID=75947 RepID=A0AAU9MIZ8_9ASTR|nr:unnamed protein product [Lactuca virosa]